MNTFLKAGAAWLILAAGSLALAQQSSGPRSGAAVEAPEKKFQDFDKVVRGAKEYDGLFKLHHKDEHLYAEIRPDQFDKPLLCPIAIARGMALGGYTLNFDEQWVLLFRRVGDKVHLIRRNVHFRAKRETPVALAVETTYTDSVLMALRIQTINPMRQSVVIDLNDIFMTNFAELRFGSFDANRSTWHKIKAFGKNIELEVSATYSGGRFSLFGDNSVIDSRGNTVIIHYGLVQLVDDGYQPRLADDRVGYFLSVVKDFSQDSRDTSFLRYVNRWRLERVDGDSKNAAKLSPPKKKIIFWIEKSVPDEHRAAVREGILEWNKAFERIGFRDAIEVRQQQDEIFDPEDIQYSTFRWITTGNSFAMGPSRANPLTGEILDADIIFDADLIRYWKDEHRFLGGGTSFHDEPLSMIQATRRGDFRFSILDPRIPRELVEGWNNRNGDQAVEGRDTDAMRRFWSVRQGMCLCASCKKYEIGLAAMAMHARDALKPGEKVPDELINQAIKETVMHEVGHTLGLRHNFKASTMLDAKQLHDKSITRERGLSGSVMDYNPVNLAPKGVKQGDYFSTTIGPYDYWAIEYAYKPLSGGTEGELEKLQAIANKGAAPGHDYGTDEDLFGTSDPLINAWDLGNDPLQFAKDRLALAEELLKGLSDRVVDKGEGYQRARQAFTLLLRQVGDSAHLAANYVGGELAHRDHAGDPSGRDPAVPVKSAQQRDALKFLQEHILSDKAFQFSPQLLRKLAADRWYHWGNERAIFAGVDYPVHERILGIQRVALDHLLSAETLARLQKSALKIDKGEQPLTLAEVFRAASDSIWSELPVKETKSSDDAKRGPPSSIIRRNLQREHVKDLSVLVLGQSRFGRRYPPDARSLARLHLRELNERIGLVLKDKAANVDDTTRAHLEERQERIGKVLSAGVQVLEP